MDNQWIMLSSVHHMRCTSSNLAELVLFNTNLARLDMDNLSDINQQPHTKHSALAHLVEAMGQHLQDT